LQAEQAQATPDQAIINELEGKIFTSAQNTNSAFLLLKKQNKFLLESLSELIQTDFFDNADLKNVVSTKKEVI
jgi:hypothetical protein